MAIGLLAAISTACAGIALFKAAIAATGIPRVEKDIAVDTIASLDLASLRQAMSVARSLLTALGLAAVAVITGAAAVGTLVFAPPDQRPAEVKITWADGRTEMTVCGSIALQNGSAVITPIAKGLPAKTIPATDLVAIGSC